MTIFPLQMCKLWISVSFWRRSRTRTDPAEAAWPRKCEVDRRRRYRYNAAAVFFVIAMLTSIAVAGR
jgi:hypothetical protein